MVQNFPRAASLSLSNCFFEARNYPPASCVGRSASGTLAQGASSECITWLAAAAASRQEPIKAGVSREAAFDGMRRSARGTEATSHVVRARRSMDENATRTRHICRESGVFAAAATSAKSEQYVAAPTRSIRIYKRSKKSLSSFVSERARK